MPGNRIKAKSLTAKQIKPGSLTGAQFKADSLEGTQINESTLTGVTASSIAQVQYVSATVALSEPSNGIQGTATCPAGTNVIGGGASVSNEAFAGLNDSAPTSTHNGWTATAYGENGTTMTVTAICTAVKATG